MMTPNPMRRWNTDQDIAFIQHKGDQLMKDDDPLTRNTHLPLNYPPPPLTHSLLEHVQCTVRYKMHDHCLTIAMFFF